MKLFNSKKQQNLEHDSNSSESKQNKGILATIASFLNPRAGFLMWMHYEDKDPEKSKKIGVAALIGKLLIIITPFVALLIAWLILKHAM